MEDFEDSEKCILGKRPRKFIDVDRPVGEILLGTIPSNAMEYLQQVQIERNYCPATVTADIDPQQFEHNRSAMYVAGNGKAETPEDFIPSSEFRKSNVRKFSNARNKLFREKDYYKQYYKGSRKHLPRINNPLAWCAFCLGNEVMLTIKANASPAEIVQYEKPERFKLHSESYEPYLHFIVYLVAPEIVKLLSYQTDWLKQIGFSDQLCKWIYCLLACLDTPLSPNGTAVLRNLARVCSQLRSTLRSKEEDALVPLNLIICLIAEYFEQKDLADS